MANNFAIKCTYCKCLEFVSSTIKYLACVIWSVREIPFVERAGILDVKGNYSKSVSVWRHSIGVKHDDSEGAGYFK